MSYIIQMLQYYMKRFNVSLIYNLTYMIIFISKSVNHVEIKIY